MAATLIVAEPRPRFPRSPRPRAARQGGIVETLREDILSLRLTPGALLSRAALQERFGLSSTPVRDALMRLREEGLVDVFPQHATFVSRIDLAEARRAQFLRRSVELELVRTLADDPDPGLVERLRSLLRQQAVVAENGEHEALARADHEFHRAMYEAADLLPLWELVRRKAGHLDRLRRLNLPVGGKAKEIVRDHGAILDAIAAGKPKKARAALRDHLSGSLQSAGRLREAHPDYFA